MDTNKISEIFVVFLYVDYRKEVEIQHLKAFSNRDKAIEFAKKYSNWKDTITEAQYVCIKGTEYDAEFCYPDEELVRDEKAYEKYQQKLNEELGVKQICGNRIAIDKVIMD